MPPTFSKIICGDYKFSLSIVCHDGIIRLCAVEEFADGFMAQVKVGEGWFTNWARYETSRKAINAAAGWDAVQLGE